MVDQEVPGLVADLVLHMVVLAHFFKHRQVVLHHLPALPQRADAVADFIDQVGEHQDA